MEVSRVRYSVDTTAGSRPREARYRTYIMADSGPREAQHSVYTTAGSRPRDARYHSVYTTVGSGHCQVVNPVVTIAGPYRPRSARVVTPSTDRRYSSS